MTYSKEKILQIENSLRGAYYLVGDPLKSISEMMVERKTPAVSVAVVEDQQVVWTGAYGQVSKEAENSVTTDTLFQAASISKPVTAFGVLSIMDPKVKTKYSLA